MRARAILETSLYAEDLEAAERFFTGVLGLPVAGRVEGRHVFFRCGRGMLLVFRPSATVEGGAVPPHGAAGPGHVAFAATAAELEEWRRHLSASAVPIEAEQDWPGGGRSLYFRDPAGNSLEIATPEVWGIGVDEAFGEGESQP